MIKPRKSSKSTEVPSKSSKDNHYFPNKTCKHSHAYTHYFQKYSKKFEKGARREKQIKLWARFRKLAFISEIIEE